MSILHHVSNGQALRLADDLMEPFRPAMDIAVYDLMKQGKTSLDKDTKAILTAVLTIDYLTKNGHTPLSHLMVRIAQSLAKIYQKQENQHVNLKRLAIHADYFL